MSTIYAEVIGDPIAQSKSPAIHAAWLEQLGLGGEFRATRIAADELGPYLANRRADPLWRGCSVTIPHKERVLPLLDGLAPGARAVGAVNCVLPGGVGLIGHNSDVDGIAAALAGVRLGGASVVLIGAGGAARAALHHVSGHGAGRITLLVRDPAQAAHLERERVEIRPFSDASAAAGAALVINASPLGMRGAPAMPPELIDALAARASGTTWFDMVYHPLETPFLAAGRAAGATGVDGLRMLIGQARAAFAGFFGRPAPADAPALRALLVTP